MNPLCAAGEKGQQSGADEKKIMVAPEGGVEPDIPRSEVRWVSH